MPAPEPPAASQPAGPGAGRLAARADRRRRRAVARRPRTATSHPPPAAAPRRAVARARSAPAPAARCGPWWPPPGARACAATTWRTWPAACAPRCPTRSPSPPRAWTRSSTRWAPARGGAIRVPSLGRAGWFEGGPRPGEPGRAVIIGHLDTKRGPGLFARVPALRARRGHHDHRPARATCTLPGGRARAQVRKDRFPTEEVYGGSARPVLVLVTCGGPYDQGRATGTTSWSTRARSEPHAADSVSWPDARDPSRHHLTRPRSPLAGHRGRRRPARRRRCRVHQGPGRRVLLRHLGGLQAAGGVDRRPPGGGARAGDRHQRLDAGRRVPVQRAGASPATWWWSRPPATTARCWPCASWAPSSWPSRWRTTAST